MLAALAEPLETTAAARCSEAAVRASPVLAEQAVATAKAEAMTAKTVGGSGGRPGRDRGRDGGGHACNDRDRRTPSRRPWTPRPSRRACAEAAEADDEAILDLIALEMAADDPSDYDDAANMASAEPAVAEFAPADPVIVAPEPEPMTGSGTAAGR